MKKKITAIFLCIALAATAIVGASLAYFTDTAQKTNTFTMGKVDITLTEPKWDEAGNDARALNPGHVYDKDPTITVEKNSMDSYVFLDVNINKYNSLLWLMARDASSDGDIQFNMFTDNTYKVIRDEFKNEAGQFSSSKFLTYMMKYENQEVFRAIVNKWFGGITHSDWKTFGVYYDKTAVYTNEKGQVKSSWLTIRLGYQKDGGIVSANNTIKFMDSFGMPASVTQDMIAEGVSVGGQQNPFNTEKETFKIDFKAYAIQADTFVANEEAKTSALDAAYAAMFAA